MDDFSSEWVPLWSKIVVTFPHIIGGKRWSFRFVLRGHSILT